MVDSLSMVKTGLHPLCPPSKLHMAQEHLQTFPLTPHLCLILWELIFSKLNALENQMCDLQAAASLPTGPPSKLKVSSQCHSPKVKRHHVPHCPPLQHHHVLQIIDFSKEEEEPLTHPSSLSVSPSAL